MSDNTTPVHIISLGAGVQSSTMALMAAAGEITPMPSCAIFADTGAEPDGVYRQLDYLAERLPFPIHRVGSRNLRDDILSGDKHASWGRPPFFVVNDNGKAGQLRRQCTGDYKLDPIRRKIRELMGLTKRKSPKETVVVQWIGISIDEATRMKESLEPWQLNRWPLIEKWMSRKACLRWMREHGHPEPPKSACTFCSYRPDKAWMAMKRDDPKAFAEAVKVDEAIRNGMPGVNKSLTYIHRSLTPLSEAIFDLKRDQNQFNMFENECEGMCGV